MDNPKTMPVREDHLACQHCFADNDKTHLIEKMRAQLENDAKSVLMARCIACKMEFMILIDAKGQCELVDINPYEELEQKKLNLDKIPNLPIAKNDAEALSMFQEGIKHFENQNYPSAYASWRAAQEWFLKQPQSKAESCALLSNIGIALDRMGDTKEAISCYESALLMMNQNEKPDEYATVLNNLGAAYLHLGRMSDAEKYHKQAYELHVQHGKDEALLLRERDNLAFTYAKIGSQYFRLDDLENSVRATRSAAALFDVGQSAATQGALHYLRLGNLLLRKGEQLIQRLDFSAALGCFEEALLSHEIAKAPELVILRDANCLSEVYRKLGDIDKALDAMQKVEELRETLKKMQTPSLTVFKKTPEAGI